MYKHEGYGSVPKYILESLDNYARERTPTGDFLKAVLSNDLYSAVGRADPTCMNCLKFIVIYVNCQLPAGCWGSPEAVKEWLKGE